MVPKHMKEQNKQSYLVISQFGVYDCFFYAIEHGHGHSHQIGKCMGVELHVPGARVMQLQEKIISILPNPVTTKNRDVFLFGLCCVVISSGQVR
jgi:hypothetical protein